jgi:hypothetical protein
MLKMVICQPEFASVCASVAHARSVPPANDMSPTNRQTRGVTVVRWRGADNCELELTSLSRVVIGR